MIRHFPNTVKLLTINRVFFSFIVSDRLFREKWPVYFTVNLHHVQRQTGRLTLFSYAPIGEKHFYLFSYYCIFASKQTSGVIQINRNQVKPSIY